MAQNSKTKKEYKARVNHLFLLICLKILLLLQFVRIYLNHFFFF